MNFILSFRLRSVIYFWVNFCVWFEEELHFHSLSVDIQLSYRHVWQDWTLLCCIVLAPRWLSVDCEYYNFWNLVSSPSFYWMFWYCTPVPYRLGNYNLLCLYDFCVLEKHVCFAVIRESVPQMSVKFSWFIILLKSSIYLLIFP